MTIPAPLCGTVWRTLRGALARHRADGGHLAPGVAELLEELRAAALTHTLEASGHSTTQVPDISASSGEVHTDRLAGLLGCTDRHARRVARAAGLKQTRRGYWAAADVAALEAARRRR
ncbi:hypothetical protein [Planomonospora parontospora]|uniref:hypothetical protein n=1 Tax=Planomonospora parontospora TaxID=58119 RepID=UPI00177D43F6|nr:hypothetical protein [Planomonospora parontospora]